MKLRMIKRYCLTVFGFEQIEFFEFFSYFLKILELSNYKPTIFSSFKSYEIFNSANLNLKESLIFMRTLIRLKILTISRNLIQ